MNIVLEKITKNDFKSVKNLYLSAFPRNERPPFCLLESRAEKGVSDFYIAKDSGSFVGFAYVICYLDIAYLFYLAIDGKIRGNGYGSAVITELKKIYEGKRFFLAREMLDSTADNYEQRVKRHEFYLKNGFVDLPIKIKEASVTYDVMGINGTVKKEEYDAMMNVFFGRFIRKFVDMRLIEE